MRWRAYYGDGSTVDSSEMHWNSLPGEGVVGVVVFGDPPYRRILDGYDWIYMVGDELHTVMTADEWGQWAPKPLLRCMSCVKRGAAVPDDKWAAIQAAMLADREWPAHV